MGFKRSMNRVGEGPTPILGPSQGQPDRRDNQGGVPTAQPPEEEHQPLAQLQEVHKVQTSPQECKNTLPAGSSSTECKPHPKPPSFGVKVRFRSDWKQPNFLPADPTAGSL